MKESDLYEPIKQHFTDLGFAIYAEVEVRYCGGRVDVVAFNHPAAIAIELKQSLTFDLIDQAMHRKRVFPYVYIAYPKKKTQPIGWLHRYFLEHGIGVLEVDKDGTVHTVLKAKYQRAPLQRKVKMKDVLKPEHQEWVPGGHAGGGYVTNYAITMKGVRHYLHQARRFDQRIKERNETAWQSNGWRSVKEILEHCETHYSTPRNSLGKALEDFELSWCQVKRENGRLWFRHKEENG